MEYLPMSYSEINAYAGATAPYSVKAFNNKTFNYWCRSLFQRACSVFDFALPDEWQGEIKDYFIYLLFSRGFMCVFNNDDLGTVFSECTISGKNFYHLPTDVKVANHTLKNGSVSLEIGKDTELIKLCPDYRGICDIIIKYAVRLSDIDASVDMSVINNRLAYIIGSRNKASGEAIKKIFDKISRGEPTIIYDMKLLNDTTDKDSPWQFLERSNLKASYITTDLLNDFQTELNNFDAEIGIPTLSNFGKKERMVASEAQSRIIDSTSRLNTWFNTLKSSIDKVNKMFNLNLSVTLHYDYESAGGDANE